MSVDLIAGVIQGANPSAANQVKSRLASQSQKPPALFDRLLNSFDPEKKLATDGMEKDILMSVIAAAEPAVRAAAADKFAPVEQLSVQEEVALARKEVAQQLEASVLTSMLNEVMPESSSLYGDDAASNLVRQFEVSNMAEATASRQPLGLAESLFRSPGGTHIASQTQWPYFVRSNITSYSAG